MAAPDSVLAAVSRPPASELLRLATLATPLACLLAGCASTVHLRPAAERPRPRQSVELEYPALDGERKPLQIAYFQAGVGRDLYVLVHGLATNADTWARVVRGFAEHGRVVALDLPGSGWSDAPRDFAYDIPGLADVTAQFIRRAPGLAGLPPDTVPVIAGVSLGGGVTVYCSVMHRIPARALLLAGPACYPQEIPGLFETIRGPFGPAILWLSTWLPGEKTAGRIYHRKEVLTPDLGAMLSAQRRNPERRAALLATFRNALDLELARELSPRVAEIDAPTLVVIGREDALVPAAHAELWQASLPHARVEVLEDCGHAVPEERPEAFLDLCGKFLGWPGTGSAPGGRPKAKEEP